MRKYLVVLFTLISGLVFSQNAARLEGVWQNQEGEILEMGWNVWTRKSKQGEELASGTWEEKGPNTLFIRRVSGEEYDIDYSIAPKGMTWAIEQPFSETCWIWFRIQ